ASSEFIPLAKLSDSITFAQYGRDRLIKDKPTEKDKDLALRGLKDAREAIVSGEYDLVILDEANVAAWFDLLSVDDLIDLIKKKPDHVELVFTGRKADPKLIEAADLVTEMREIKHYYTQGVSARTGIED
ncbi:MAG: ATP:corrinoid adenosyltransferase BtuR/CobO/CobP, partial [Deltaproteobacteria bacterium]|nr:ATP:corrinoid adenosyltransferase BtuR/CobO/CobP [Deltaproteobacteria bacterium]